MTENSEGRNAAFPVTHWSLVLSAGDSGSPPAAAALEELCRSYWPPLVAFLMREGRTPEDAMDWVQEFLARLIDRRDLATVSPDKGRFRSYLLAGLKNWVSKRSDHARAQKRGGGRSFVPFDAAEVERVCIPESASEATPDVAFDRAWARLVLNRAMKRLEDEHRARNRTTEFEMLAPYLDGAGPGEYEALASRWGKPRGTVAVSVHRLRLRLRELVRAEVAQTVGSAVDLDTEIRELLLALAAP